MNISRNIRTGCLFLALFTCFSTLYAQKKVSAKAAAVKDMIAARNYVFVAQSALSMGGRNRQLTSQYDVKVSPDTVVSFLPYFGRAYTAPLDPTKGGIQFLSKDFDYQSTERRKGGWNIVIKPRDAQDVQSLSFTISEEGYASLQVVSNNRQPISFTGYIQARKTKQ